MVFQETDAIAMMYERGDPIEIDPNDCAKVLTVSDYYRLHSYLPRSHWDELEEEFLEKTTEEGLPSRVAAHYRSLLQGDTIVLNDWIAAVETSYEIAEIRRDKTAT